MNTLQPGRVQRTDKVAHEPVVVAAIDADAMLHRNGNRHRILHRLTQSATSDGSAIRHAPNAPRCTRSDGQPQLRLISS